MKEIDFLPAKYREQSAQRRSQLWRLVVGVTFGVMVIATALFQQALKVRAENDLGELAGQYEQAVQQTNRLTEAQTQLRAASSRADLYLFLDHTWPRTQILDAVCRRLPDTVVLTGLQVTRTLPAEVKTAAQQFGAIKSAQQNQQQHLLPAERDLQELRKLADPAQTIVTISGTTRDEAALHEYLGHLARESLLVNVNLESIKQSAAERGQGHRMQFSVRIKVRPAYGQPGGPAGESESVATTLPPTERHSRQ